MGYIIKRLNAALEISEVNKFKKHLNFFPGGFGGRVLLPGHRPCPRPAQWRYDQAGLGHVLGLVASHEGVRAEGPEASLALS